MDTEKKIIPTLRFHEYENSPEWKEALVKDICSIGTGKSNSQDQVGNGEYPFFIRSEIPVRSNRYLYDCEAVITIGDGKIGKVFHYIKGKFDLHQRCYKMTDFKSVDGKFFYYFFSSHFYDRAMRLSAKATVDSVRLEMISEMPIYYPTIYEQRKIAECLSSIDTYIISVKEKIEQLKEHKKSLLQKLFPQNGKTVPEYRFPEFKKSGVWEEVKMGDIFSRNKNKNVKNIQNVLTISAQNGLVNQYEFFHKNVAAFDLTNYYLIRKGDFAYNKSRSQGHPYGVIKTLRLYEEGVVSTLYICFRIKSDNYLVDFFEQYFETGLINEGIGTIAQEGARNHGLLNISTNDFFNKIVLTIPPSTHEQYKIASTLSSIDKLINNCINKINLMEKNKKGLMQQLFPTSK